MSASLLTALAAPAPVVSVELRPPRAELGAAEGLDAWIDTYHAVRGFVRSGTFVFLTDSAVGTREEHNLRHLTVNLGTDVPRDQIVPFLTTKHSLEFCLDYAERAWQEGFRSIVVLGGDQTVGPPRCVSHAWQLRRAIRQHVPELLLGGWANPHADADRQAGFIADGEFYGDFFLTQIVSHHDQPALDRFQSALSRRQVEVPGLVGVFYYRSASRRTLELLRQFMPVPAEALAAEFAAGATPEEVAARTIAMLAGRGLRHTYLSNLQPLQARQTLSRIVAAAAALGPVLDPGS
jgi:5,10-methylenetetrahydrofolate reductase